MEIVINSSKTKKAGKTPRRYLLEENHQVIKDYLIAHGIPVSSDLLENCKSIAKNVAIQKQRFDKEKQKGMTPAKFANFAGSDSYKKMFENFLSEDDAQRGVNFEGNAHDFFDIQKGLGNVLDVPTSDLIEGMFNSEDAKIARNANFENFDLKGLASGVGKTALTAATGGASDAIQGGVSGIFGGNKGGGMTRDDVTNIALQAISDLFNNPTAMSKLKAKLQLPSSEPVLQGVKNNAILEGGREWMSEEKQKAIDNLLKKGETEKRDNEIKAQLIKIGVSPTRFKNFQNFDGSFSDKAKDILSGIIEHEKESETAKGTLQAMPKIIVLVVLALIIGFVVAKKM